MSYPLENISLTVDNFDSIFIRWNCNIMSLYHKIPHIQSNNKAGKEHKQLSLHYVKQHKGSVPSQQIATRLSEKEQIAKD